MPAVPAEPSPDTTVVATSVSPLSTAGLLRFTTAGSVDDGKSTLIGRLLYDSQSVLEDQLASVRKSKVNRSTGPIDFSLLTDGLRAEREQGITIDVAYRYFATPRRKFIIADTPGHEQYTRNMATGASTADAAMVLIDATKGVLRQSRRHAFIASLLGVQHIVAAVNKMDLVGFSQDVFDRIAAEFREFAAQLGISNLYAVPVSALEGDNVVRRSKRMPWFEGPALLEYLERLELGGDAASGPLRFPGAVRDPSGRNFPRLRRPVCVGRVARGNERGGAAFAREDAREIDRDVRRRNGGRGPGRIRERHARRRNRYQPWRHARRRDRCAVRGHRISSHARLDACRAAGSAQDLLAQAHHAHGSRRASSKCAIGSTSTRSKKCPPRSSI